jgi:hypothetical protein
MSETRSPVGVLLAQRAHKRRSDPNKAYWTPERRKAESDAAKQRYAYRIECNRLKVKLFPMWQAAYQECYVNRWSYTAWPRSCIHTHSAVLPGRNP